MRLFFRKALLSSVFNLFFFFESTGKQGLLPWGQRSGAVASPEEVETEATAGADLTPEVEDIMAPETTIIAGVKVAMETGLQEGPTETATTVTLHTTSKNPS